MDHQTQLWEIYDVTSLHNTSSVIFGGSQSHGVQELKASVTNNSSSTSQKPEHLCCSL